MPEIYINIIVALALYGAVYLIRSKYSDRITTPVRKGIYWAGIAFFIFITIYSFNNPMNETRRIISLAVNAGLIGYFFYKIFSVDNEGRPKVPMEKEKAEIEKINAETAKIKSETRSKCYNNYIVPIFALSPLIATFIVLYVTNIFDTNTRLTDANKKLLDIQKFKLDTAEARFSRDSIQIIVQKDSLTLEENNVAEQRNYLKRAQDSLADANSILNEKKNKLTKEERQELNFEIRFENLVHDSAGFAVKQYMWTQALEKIDEMNRPIRGMHSILQNDQNDRLSASLASQFYPMASAYSGLRSALQLGQGVP